MSMRYSICNGTSDYERSFCGDCGTKMDLKDSDWRHSIMNNEINNDCCFSNCFCYDCPYRYCKHEDELFNKLVNQTIYQIERELFWIYINFEYEDETAKRAFTKYKMWLKSQGFEGNHPPTYKTWIAYCEDKTPITECGYHTGTFYFHKTNGGADK